MENIVAKGETARSEQFLLLSLCFQKAVFCRDVRKRLYECTVHQLVTQSLKKLLNNISCQFGGGCMDAQANPYLPL